MITLSSSSDVNLIKLGTRYDGQTTYAFPIDFTIQYWNGSQWVRSVSLDHYPRPNSQWVTIRLPEAIRTQYIRIHASKLSQDDRENRHRYFQLSEVAAGYDPAQAARADFLSSRASASSSLWPATHLTDNNNGSIWSSDIRAAVASTEWISYGWDPWTLQTNYVKLLPRYHNNVALGFPVDFTIYYLDAQGYHRGATVTSFPRPTGGGWVTIPLQAPVFARGIYIVATKLGADDNGSYVFQLAAAHAGYNAAHHQQLALCPVAGSQVIVHDSMTLNPTCNYSNVRYSIEAADLNTLGRNIELDCNGATLSGPPRAQHPDPTPDGKGTNWPAVSIGPTWLEAEALAKLPNVVVKDCKINGYYDALFVGGGYSPEIDSAIEIYERKPPYDTWTQQERDSWVKVLMKSARTKIAGKILFDQIVINAPRHEGLYLAGAVQGVTFTRGEITDAKGPAIYFGNASGGNTILDNDIRAPYNDAIRVDSSAENLIKSNRLTAGGITVFKNCGEGENSIPGGPRPQHSWGNVFDGNTFSGMVDSDRVALSIAHRSSSDLHHQNVKSWLCSDDIYFSERTKPLDLAYLAYYYRDFAEDTVVRNNTFEDGSRIVVQDDGAHITNNKFSGGTDYYVKVGSRIRNASGTYSTYWIPQGDTVELVTRNKVSEPVVGTVVTGNSFAPSLQSNVRWLYGSAP